jgi:predicted phage baseplate assembly protein
MPLDPPKLDTRTFEDLLTEARLRIPQYTPEWTDFNDSDPGMTLVQLFAWFTELMLYQMNKVPDLNYIKFLQLLNLELQPARPATTHVVFKLTNDAPVTAVEARTRFDVPLKSGAGLPYFEATTAVDLSPYTLDSVQVFDGAAFADFSAFNEDGSQKFRPLGWSPQPGSALYLGFKPREGVEETRPKFPQELVFRVFLPVAPGSAGQAYSNGVKLARPQQTLVWEYRSRLDLAAGQTPDTLQRWRPLAMLDDQTRALTKEGNIQIRGPGDDILATAEGKLTDPKHRRYWLRLRLAEGAYADGAVPEIAFVRSNIVEVENLLTVTDEELGVSDGAAQTYTLRQVPVADRTLKLEVKVPSRPQPDVWTQVDDFLGSKPTSRHYTLDPVSGEIKFGDADKGMIPEPGGTITARSYKAGGGAAGNVAAGDIAAPPGTVSNVDSVTNPRAALGGKDEETLDHLKALAPKAARGVGRAVTLADYQWFAENMPGVIKAAAIANRHPDFPGFPVPGAVMVVIVPDDGANEPKPLPELRDLVYTTLDKVRLVTSELFVADPRYRRFEVQATVVPGEGTSPQAVKDQLEEALKNYFRPTNWTFGAKLYPSVLYEVLLDSVDQKSGYKLVKAVTMLNVTSAGQDVPIGTAIPMADDELPACAQPTVTVLDT